MATRTPSLQARSQHGHYWGQYASTSALPNASGNPLATPYHSQLEAGDVAFVTGGTLYVCSSPGSVSGGDAVWSALAGGGGAAPETVLWEWNRTDVSQFGASIPVGGAGLITPIVVTGGGRVNPRLSLAVTGANGPMVLPISGLSLPRRYAIEYTMRTHLGLSGRDFGFMVYATASYGYGVAVTQDLSATNRHISKVEGGIWSLAESIGFLTQGNAQKRRVEWSSELSAPGASGPGAWELYEERRQSGFASDVRNSAGVALGFGDWTGQVCDRVGIVIGRRDASVWDVTVEIEDFRIVSLPTE